jgi:hypothetical protein
LKGKPSPVVVVGDFDTGTHAQLTTRDRQTLSIVGGEIAVALADVTAPGGRINLVSVNSPGDVVADLTAPDAPPAESPGAPEAPISPPAPEPEELAPAVGNGDDAAERLVAMKLAVDGNDRAAIEAELNDRFGAGDRAALLEDVLSRAGR